MKRVFIVMLCLAAVACVGSQKGDDRGGEANTPTAESMGGSVRNEAQVGDNVALMAENYQEMAMSAIENCDNQAFVSTMEQMTAWLNGLTTEDRAKADAAIKAWDEANKERKEASFEKALTMPRMTSDEAKAISAKQ